VVHDCLPLVRSHSLGKRFRSEDTTFPEKGMSTSQRKAFELC
jgi:hypothetical protein